MTPRDVPGVAAVFDAGPADRVYDSLLLAGPPVIAVIAVLGRSPVTEALAVAYVGAFLAYVLYRGVGVERSGGRDDQ